MLVEDVSKSPDSLEPIEGVTSEICVPLFDEGEAVGLLDLESVNGVKLTENDLRVIVAVSEHVDLAISRRVPMPMRSGTALELRAEAFNLLNTAPFASPGAILGTTTFGVISSAGDPRVVQLAAKLLF